MEKNMDFTKIFPMKSTSPNPPPPPKKNGFFWFRIIEGLLPNVGVDEDSVTAFGFDQMIWLPRDFAWENTPSNYHQKCLAILRKRDPNLQGEVY